VFAGVDSFAWLRTWRRHFPTASVEPPDSGRVDGWIRIHTPRVLYWMDTVTNSEQASLRHGLCPGTGGEIEDAGGERVGERRARIDRGRRGRTDPTPTHPPAY